MAHKELNYFKHFRSGYLSRDSLILKYRGEIDWLSNQVNMSIIRKLEIYCPELLESFDDRIQLATLQVNHMEFRACQQNIREIYKLLREIKRAVVKIEFLIEVEELYERIDDRILKYPGLEFACIRQFSSNLDHARAALRNRAYSKAWFYTDISHGELNASPNGKAKGIDFRKKGDQILEIFKETETWAVFDTEGIDVHFLEIVIQEIYEFMEEGRYVLVDRLLGDLGLEVASRSAFYREYERAKRILPEDLLNKLTWELRSILSESGWASGGKFLVEEIAKYIKNDL